MLRQLLRIQTDAHRQTLHDLDPVARGILRRQYRERTAGARSQAQHPAVEVHPRAVHVDRHIRALADAQVAELVLLEVGIDPHRLDRQDREHLGSRGDLLTELDCAAHDVAGHWRDDPRARVGQPRRTQARFRLQNPRMRRRVKCRRSRPACSQAWPATASVRRARCRRRSVRAAASPARRRARRSGGDRARRPARPARAAPAASARARRSRSSSANSCATSRTVWARLALACASATSASRGSSCTSTCPRCTNWVESVSMRTTVPDTCGVSRTRLPLT